MKRLPAADGLNRVRRQLEMRADQAWAAAAKQAGRVRRRRPRRESGGPRLALVTVNFSTTRYLKLMLLTLSEQRHLALVERLVIVDNGSRDGGTPFLRGLARRVTRVHLVEHKAFLNHARGMRAGVRALAKAEREAGAPAADLILFCDVDVVFRDPDTLGALAQVASEREAAVVGEVRTNGPNPEPDIQASFFVVRRDVYERPDVAPLVNHGSPAYWLQRSVRRLGLPVVDFPSNFGGYVLHRGRTGVAAAGDHRPRHSYAKVASRHPHFMGVAHGPDIWAAVEGRYSHLLEPAAEASLLDLLAARLAALGHGRTA